MQTITMPEIRELLKSVETIAVRPGITVAEDLLKAPVLFKKLIESRTEGLIQIQVLIDGKPIEFEVT